MPTHAMCIMKDGRNKMKITYDSKYDVLYLKFVEGKNRQLTNTSRTILLWISMKRGKL
jgi:uncharacterized protein YuzE